MQEFSYLIAGGGMAADAAVKGIREVDSEREIGMISAEQHPPYKRPPLSKKLWKGAPEESIWLNTESKGVRLMLGRRIARLDPAAKRVTDSEGNDYLFDKLLLATGATPRRLPLDYDDIIYYRTLDDYSRLRELANRGGAFLVIGGGFIGSEVAAALAMNGKNVTLVFPETGIGARIYPRELSNYLVDYYRSKGVAVLTGDVVKSAERHGDRARVTTQSGREMEVDGIVAGVGVTPDTALSADAGLPVQDGVVVDELLTAGHPDVFAAGDVASFHNPALERRIRVEHEDNAVTMGKLAGRNMASDKQPYDYLPYFYSDLFDLGYEAVGELDISANETFADWREPFQEGVIYYLRDGRVRGVLLWNVWDKVPEARELISAPGPFNPENLRGRIAA